MSAHCTDYPWIQVLPPMQASGRVYILIGQNVFGLAALGRLLLAVHPRVRICLDSGVCHSPASKM